MIDTSTLFDQSVPANWYIRLLVLVMFWRLGCKDVDRCMFLSSTGSEKWAQSPSIVLTVGYCSLCNCRSTIISSTDRLDWNGIDHCTTVYHSVGLASIYSYYCGQQWVA